MALYYASKNFVRSFSEALHHELRRTGVTVTCVAPGPVSTEFLEKSGADQAALFKILPKLDAEYVAERAWRGFKFGRRLVVPRHFGQAGSSLQIALLLSSVVLLPLIGGCGNRRSKEIHVCLRFRQEVLELRSGARQPSYVTAPRQTMHQKSLMVRSKGQLFERDPTGRRGAMLWTPGLRMRSPVWLREVVLSVEDAVPFVAAHSVAPLAASVGVRQATRRVRRRAARRTAVQR